jgi:hypothetical protein
MVHRVFLVAALVLCGASASPAVAAEIDEDFYFDEATPMPATVLALQDCGADERTTAHRQPFAGGFVFAIQCASNNENLVETLVFAEQQDGTGGRLLEFPLPAHRGGGTQDTIANIRWDQERGEIGEIFVDREVEERVDPDVCRTEGRWRLDGEQRQPTLVFWRETEDCEGKTGWVVVVSTPDEN